MQGINTLSGLARIIAMLLAMTMLHGFFGAADRVTGNAPGTATVTDEATGETTELPAAGLPRTMAELLQGHGALSNSPFFQNLIGKLGSADLSSHLMRLTIPAQMTGGEPTIVTLLPGENGPTLWVEAAGQAVGTPVSELADLGLDVADLLGTLTGVKAMTTAEGRAATAALALDFYQRVVAPGVSMSVNAEGKPAVTFNLTGEQMAEGLADWLQSLAGREDLFDSLNMREGARHLMLMLLRAQLGGMIPVNPGEPFDPAATEAILRVVLEQLAMQLRASPPDLTVSAVLTMDGGNFDLQATLTANGQTVALEAAKIDVAGGSILTLRLTDGGETEYVNAVLTWETENGVTLFDLGVRLGQTRRLEVQGTASRDALHAEVRFFGKTNPYYKTPYYDTLLFSASVSAVRAEDAVNVSISGLAEKDPFAVEVNLMRRRIAATLRLPRMSADVSVRRIGPDQYGIQLDVADNTSRQRPGLTSVDAVLGKDEEGNWTLYADLDNGWETITWDGEMMRDDSEPGTNTLALFNISENEFVIDTGAWYRRIVYDEEKGIGVFAENDYSVYLETIQFIITEGEGDSWTLTVTNDSDHDGRFTSATVAVLEYADQAAGEALTTRPDAIRLTRYDMYNALWQMLTAPFSAQPGYAPVYP